MPVYFPFAFNFDMVSDDTKDAELYLAVRTRSRDFQGERTDLHDVLSLLWAVILRVREVASTRLLTVLNPATGCESEIYARYLLPAQPGSLAADNPLLPRAETVSSESFSMSQLLKTVFGPDPREDSLDPGYDTSPALDWIPKVRRRLRLETQSDFEIRTRSYPDWTYFGCNRLGTTVVDIGAAAAARLRAALAAFEPRTWDGVDAILYRTDKFQNAVRKETLARLVWLAKRVDGRASTLIVIPTDSHVIAVGNACLVAVRDLAGHAQFDAERDKLRARRAAEAELLFESHVVHWADAIDDGRFELLIGTLLLRERGVLRVRQVGATREPDDGRDFLVDWRTMPDRGGETRQRPGESLSEQRQVIVQIKVRRSGVGRSDLPGLRDTVEHYHCNGLLVVAFPRATVPLMNHLAELRRRGQWWVDWWGQTELEERVRRNPEVAELFPDIVKLDLPTNENRHDR
ncbi:hypothetical protein ASD53_05970 [Lysobacter sp. Root559]|nr:hypothetical protein ASD53_05970 [Lysobacter sp. Root559]